MNTTPKQRAAALYNEYQTCYGHSGFDRKAFVKRLVSLARTIDRNDTSEENVHVIMYLDVVSLRSGVPIVYKDEL